MWLVSNLNAYAANTLRKRWTTMYIMKATVNLFLEYNWSIHIIGDLQILVLFCHIVLTLAGTIDRPMFDKTIRTSASLRTDVGIFEDQLIQKAQVNLSNLQDIADLDVAKNRSRRFAQRRRFSGVRWALG